VTGSFFKSRSLALLLVLILIEAVLLTAVGVRIGALWTIINLVAIQIGYFAGLLTRWSVEQAGYSIPPVRIRWPQ
jgi:hypothetical protein